MHIQQSLFFNPPSASKNNTTSTFINNMKLPIHRWLRFSAGFSAHWVEQVIKQEIQRRGDKIKLLDPFVETKKFFV